MKVITAAAGLETGTVTPESEFEVVSSANVGGREINNAHQELCGGTFVESFAHSCNSVFAPLGVDLGSETLVSSSERFGFNERPTLYRESALRLTNLPTSTIPTELVGDTVIGVSAIGQGEVLATPLQMASIAQTIANDGVRSPTWIVKGKALRGDAEPVRATPKKVARQVGAMMVEVVESGTGPAGGVTGVEVAGKTGTAELGPKPGATVPEGGGQPEQAVTAWFISYAPANNPRYAIAVMIPNADADGGTAAAPISGEILASLLG